MKYKVGDRVKIKTWVDMAKEFDSTGLAIAIPGRFVTDMEEALKSISNRILTIKGICNEGVRYSMVEIGWIWSDEMIEELVEEAIFNSIDNRFEILDLGNE